MTDITLVAPNRLDILLDDKIDAEMMHEALEKFVNLSKDIEHGRLMYKIEAFHMPTLGAMKVKLSQMPDLFKLIKKFDKAAVVTDKNWLQKVSEFEGILLPGLEIKGFDKGQYESAEQWLAE